ncbi:hypothetical protein K2173_008040 [Erythroxylum novogranatense]|uniref:Uncharacterized protein n=1 Tax=Erythroxylum novogranatense TaxID=1862640 RepID=A0AAV8T893_9ROSI|nr:hypothetical protein K2173_008040 [Erythroxylum novogranatense]
MARYSCCLWLPGRKKEKMVGDQLFDKVDDFNKALKSLKVGPEYPVTPLKIEELKTLTASALPASDDMPNEFACAGEMSRKTLKRDDASEVAYEGEDEHEENVSLRRDVSDPDLQSFKGDSSGCELSADRRVASFNSFASEFTEQNAIKSEKNHEGIIDVIQSGHVSDPGITKGRFCDSPKLKRSCSNLETSKMLKVIAEVLPPSKLLLYGESHEQSEKWRTPGSPASVRSHCSADKVILRKHSSSQVLPSRNRKLWWKLFLWSHRNLHKVTAKQQQQPQFVGTDLNQKGGYHSDTVEPNRAMMLSRTQSPESLIGESMNKDPYRNGEMEESWRDIGDSFSGFWPQNRWVAFPTESTSYSRVDEWVKDLETQMPPSDDDVDDDNDGAGGDEGIIFPPSPLKDKSPLKSTAAIIRSPDNNLSEDILIANSVIQSLNSSTTAAHISAVGLKATPIMSHFLSLRSVDLSNNSIVCITPGSLPKGLHVLNLSRNKISTIEGLRELTRLRVLDLSYNRMSRIGQGLSNCTMIKELSLAGNKISNVEGLHRLLKLTVLDLSFNKITTAKALGQLVANYHSLQALNLSGNPIQTNIGDDHLHKAICSLLPKVVYLNKQPIKSQRAREVVTDSVAKAALGNRYNSRRNAARRVSSSGSPSSVHRSSASVSHRSSRNRSKNRTSYPKATRSLLAPSSR